MGKMDFDFEAFAGALWGLSQALDKSAEMIGLPRAVLARLLRRHATVNNKTWDAKLWESAASDKKLAEWIWRERKKFDARDESEVLRLAREIPGRIRRNLIEIAKSIPASRGGNPPALNLIERWQVRKQVRDLHGKGQARDKAYEIVAKRMAVSKHTVRRYCDERERSRSLKY